MTPDPTIEWWMKANMQNAAKLREAAIKVGCRCKPHVFATEPVHVIEYARSNRWKPMAWWKARVCENCGEWA